MFGVVARRLTSEQHAALFRYAHPRLTPFTQQRIASPRTAQDKTTHGDLDILTGNWAEGEGFKSNFAVDPQEAEQEKTRSIDADHWRAMGGEQGHAWSASEVCEWAR